MICLQIPAKPHQLATPAICAIPVGSLTPTFLVPEIGFLRGLCIELWYKDRTLHSFPAFCHRIQFGVEREANSVINFCLCRSHVVYIGHTHNYNLILWLQGMYLWTVSLQLSVLRGSVPEEAIQQSRSASSKNVSAKDIVDFVAPEVQLSCLKVAKMDKKVCSVPYGV